MRVGYEVNEYCECMNGSFVRAVPFAAIPRNVFQCGVVEAEPREHREELQDDHPERERPQCFGTESTCDHDVQQIAQSSTDQSPDKSDGHDGRDVLVHS